MTTLILLASLAAPPALHIEGNRLLDEAGQAVRLRGVSIASLEWSNGGEHIMESIATAMGDWKANCIRLPLAQDRWYGKAEWQNDDGAGYRKLVGEAVAAVSERNGYLVLDLHWSNAGVWGRYIGQHKMPDENSTTFWTDVATTYADNPAVLFDLYNEPHGVSWETWRDGGEVSEEIKGETVTYTAPGLQDLLETVRATGAENVCIAGGLDWGYSLKGIAEGHALTDPAGAVMYGSHIYPWKGANPENWEPHVTVVADRYPIFVGEVGCEPDDKHEDPHTWGPKMLAWLEAAGIHWTAWCFHPGASPRMLAGWDYAPTEYWGRYVKEELRARN